MVPSLFHVPKPAGTLAIVCGTACTISIFFSVYAEGSYVANATRRLSGDQKICDAPSVPGTRRAASESRARIHSALFPSRDEATNASAWPSGETAMNADD